MKSCLCVVVVLAACAPAARADGPWPLYDGCRWSVPKLTDEWRKRRCWCPDDYCPKRLPCVPPNPVGCVDDYCRKPLPCVSPNAKGCADDYCPKACPLFLGPLCEPWYKCGSGAYPRPPATVKP
jgi:hypothetical protein